jgi:hypothetical protein
MNIRSQKGVPTTPPGGRYRLSALAAYVSPSRLPDLILIYRKLDDTNLELVRLAQRAWPLSDHEPSDFHYPVLRHFHSMATRCRDGAARPRAVTGA